MDKRIEPNTKKKNSIIEILSNQVTMELNNILNNNIK